MSVGRRFAEPTLIAIAYSFEQLTHHRRAPRLRSSSSGEASLTSTRAEALPITEGVRFEATAAGAVPFSASARFVFDASTRRLGYDIALPVSSLEQIGVVYLPRRTTRPNGGVAYILAKSAAATIAGTLVLSEQEANDLKAGKLYVAVISRTSPQLSARADLILPPAGSG